ncbi:uncharacterized protein AB675_4130 [Cyphellophora attinorum]|uniref:Uncharacterized protein n=1 Tax=Cyphellophora attinorum TaxID=1664694 RepID=A0A0N1NYG9_9EURO|nr:uncharacterized protein AB675_4130 [Phialophora attinorum]KPI38630.1 hypothetical protein AB675_4130 [Phialophora attinorum]
MAAPFQFNFAPSQNKSTTQPAFTFSQVQQPAASQQPQQQTSTNISSTAIDLEHLRPTTKYDAAHPDIQRVIEGLDTAILNQIQLAGQIPDIIRKLEELGQNLPAGLDLVSAQLEHLTNGLENDAEAVVAVRDGTLKKGEGEAKCVFRAVDRLKVPRQYQVGHKQNESINGGVYGGSGLSGWWNNPQTLKSSTKADTKGETMQLPGEDVDDSGPKNLVEMFNNRAGEMAGLMSSNRELLAEIEDFVGGLEDKIRSKERQLNDRMNLGVENGQNVGETEHQLQLLKYVFGEVDRGMYEVAGKVGAARDDVLELGRSRI